MEARETAVREAVALIGKRKVVLAIHDASFPSAVGEDVGRRSSYSRGGCRAGALRAAAGFRLAAARSAGPDLGAQPVAL